MRGYRSSNTARRLPCQRGLNTVDALSYRVSDGATDEGAASLPAERLMDASGSFVPPLDKRLPL